MRTEHDEAPGRSGGAAEILRGWRGRRHEAANITDMDDLRPKGSGWKELLAWIIVLATLALFFAGLGGAMSGVRA